MKSDLHMDADVPVCPTQCWGKPAPFYGVTKTDMPVRNVNETVLRGKSPAPIAGPWEVFQPIVNVILYRPRELNFLP